jgi:integrase
MFFIIAASAVRSSSLGLNHTNSVETYHSMLQNHLLPTFGSTPLKRISPGAVRSWNAELAGTHPVTAAKAYRLLKGILETAVTDELVVRNPCVVKGASQERSPERPMVSIGEVDALVAAMPAPWRIAVELAAWCHLRVGEVLGLERRDIDLLHGAVRVERTAYDVNGQLYLGPPKTAAGKRIVSVPPHILSALEQHLEAHVGAEPSAPLLTGPEGWEARRASPARSLVHRSRIDRAPGGPFSRPERRGPHVGRDTRRHDS